VACRNHPGATNSPGADPDNLAQSRGRYRDVYIAGLGANLYFSDAARSGGWVLSPVLTIEVGPDPDFTTSALWVGAGSQLVVRGFHETSWSCRRGRLTSDGELHYDPRVCRVRSAAIPAQPER
jgi:hypothetical protein